MSHDVFVSYKREDESLVRPIVAALEKSGFSVWWDRDLSGGDSWRLQIEAALVNARCVIVVWTNNSAGLQGDFVRDEASRAKANNTLVPVLREKCSIPLGFGEIQAIDLIRWRGSKRDIFFQDLVRAVQAKIDGTPVPPAKGPRHRLVRRALTGTSVTMVAGIFAFGLNIQAVQDHVCSVGVMQPGISDLCGRLGSGRQAETRRTPCMGRYPDRQLSGIARPCHRVSRWCISCFGGGFDRITQCIPKDGLGAQ